MKVLNSVPIFDTVNDGFIYLCGMDDGTYWIRSVAGKWAQTKISTPMDTVSVSADFDAFQLAGVPATETDVKADDAGIVVKDPAKVTPQ